MRSKRLFGSGIGKRPFAVDWVAGLGERRPGLPQQLWNYFHA
ncbi:MAG: hypothetical protein ABR863_10365 [Roseiarcus sp.]